MKKKETHIYILCLCKINCIDKKLKKKEREVNVIQLVLNHKGSRTKLYWFIV